MAGEDKNKKEERDVEVVTHVISPERGKVLRSFALKVIDMFNESGLEEYEKLFLLNDLYDSFKKAHDMLDPKVTYYDSRKGGQA